MLWCQTRIQSLEFFLFQVFTALEWVLSELQFVVEQALCHFHRQFYGLQYKVGHFFRFYEYHLLTDFIKKLKSKATRLLKYIPYISWILLWRIFGDCVEGWIICYHYHIVIMWCMVSEKDRRDANHYWTGKAFQSYAFFLNSSHHRYPSEKLVGFRHWDPLGLPLLMIYGQ